MDDFLGEFARLPGGLHALLVRADGFDGGIDIRGEREFHLLELPERLLLEPAGGIRDSPAPATFPSGMLPWMPKIYSGACPLKALLTLRPELVVLRPLMPRVATRSIFGQQLVAVILEPQVFDLGLLERRRVIEAGFGKHPPSSVSRSSTGTAELDGAGQPRARPSSSSTPR